MLRQDTDSRDRAADRGESGRLLRKLLPFALAFVAGVALGRQRSRAAAGRRERDADPETDEGDGLVTRIASEVRTRATSGGADTAGSGAAGTDRQPASQVESSDAGGATDQPSSMGSVAGERERARARDADETAGPAESGTDSEPTEADEQPQPAGTEAAGVDEAVAELSPPEARGMPMFGLGTYRLDEYDECFAGVRQALQMGYRHVDTAEGYDNETAVGDAIVEAEIGREDLFVATKVSPENLDYDHVLSSAEESLERLGIDYLDLLYVHWPTGDYDPVDTLEAFAELREEGVIEEIGVSNFTVELLEEAVEASEEPIFANQVEMHPLCPQTEFRQFCAQDDVDVELVAYAPLARGEVADVDELREIAEKHDATPEQVSLAWLREKEVTAIPKASSEAHLRENWLSLGLDLDEEDVERIDAIDERRRVVDPDDAPWNQ